jgi:multidrug efflux pump
VVGVVLSGPAPERTLFHTARALQDRLEALPTVLSVDLAGAREEMLEVTVDPLRMEAYNVTAQDLAGVIARNNGLIAAGDLKTRQGSFAVKVPGDLRTCWRCR